MSSLSQGMGMRGRSGKWQPQARLCNPVLSMEVQRGIEAYQPQNAALGIRERSDPPLSEKHPWQRMQPLAADLQAQAAALVRLLSERLPRSLRCKLRVCAHTCA